MAIETMKQRLAEKQHKAAETKCRTVLMMLERRVENLRRKASESPEQFIAAANSADNLLQNLKHQQKLYFDKHQIAPDVFVANCKTLINKEKKTLEKIHSWPSLLTFVDFVVKEISLIRKASLSYPHLEQDARLFKPKADDTRQKTTDYKSTLDEAFKNSPRTK